MPVSAQIWILGRPREREADTEEPGFNSRLFFEGAPLVLLHARVKQWDLGCVVSSERQGSGEGSN